MSIINCGGNPGDGLPDPTSATAGDVLTLDNNKDAVWQTPSGGGSPTIISLSGSTTGTLTNLLSILKDCKSGDMFAMVSIGDYSQGTQFSYFNAIKTNTGEWQGFSATVRINSTTSYKSHAYLLNCDSNGSLSGSFIRYIKDDLTGSSVLYCNNIPDTVQGIVVKFP